MTGGWRKRYECPQMRLLRPRPPGTLLDQLRYVPPATEGPVQPVVVSPVVGAYALVALQEKASIKKNSDVV